MSWAPRRLKYWPKLRPDGAYEIEVGPDEIFLATRDEIQLRSLDLGVVSQLDPSKVVVRRLERCEAFLQMYDYAAKAVFGLSDEGYENTKRKAEVILQTHLVPPLREFT